MNLTSNIQAITTDGEPLTSSIRIIRRNIPLFLFFRKNISCRNPMTKRLDTDNELLDGKRLLQIIIATQFKSLYHINHRRTSREEKHRGTGIRLADTAQHLETIHFGHH